MASDEQFKTSQRERERQREYRRLKKLGGGDYLEGCRIENDERRSKMSPYDLGVGDANSHKSAVERYNGGPPDRCPFDKGTPEEAEYDHGWKDAMHK
jgi:hypothetical protein